MTSSMDEYQQAIRTRLFPLHLTIQSLDTSQAIVLIKAGADVNAEDAERRTPLSYAIRSGVFDIVRSLVEHGATIQTSNFMSAVIGGHVPIVEYLLLQGFPIDAMLEGDNVFHLLLWYSGDEMDIAGPMLDFLLQQNGTDALLDAKNSDGLTPLELLEKVQGAIMLAQRVSAAIAARDIRKASQGGTNSQNARQSALLDIL